jgi:hypothetical protein
MIDVPSACEKVPAILGEKKAMIAHLIGAKACKNASSRAKAIAKKIKNEGKRPKAATEDDSDSNSSRPSKRKRIAAVEKAMKQTELQVFKGINIPFSKSQMEIIETQFLRATISANLPFRWVDNPEVIKLFLMFRSAAGEVIPGRKVLSGRLLNEEASRVDKEVKSILKAEMPSFRTNLRAG